jgi:hypothetical protein
MDDWVAQMEQETRLRCEHVLEPFLVSADDIRERETLNKKNLTEGFNSWTFLSQAVAQDSALVQFYRPKEPPIDVLRKLLDLLNEGSISYFELLAGMGPGSFFSFCVLLKPRSSELFRPVRSVPGNPLTLLD